MQGERPAEVHRLHSVFGTSEEEAGGGKECFEEGGRGVENYAN